MGEKKKRKIRKFSEWPLWMKIVLPLEIVVLLFVVALDIFLATKVSKIEKIEVEPEVIEESITEEVEHKTGYMNVAVFGLDSRKGDLGSGNRSDTMMVISLNHETNEVKMVSVYRDTLMKLNDGSYNKANAAYAFFGPEGALALINKNMDLNIEKYVSVNFNALVDVIDAVGGLDIEMTDAEVVHMNNYCVETSKVTGKSYEKIVPEVAGTYHLNGVQAVSYSRIRYTAGGDVQRTVRQRLVIGKILEKLQDLDFNMVNEIIDSVFPQVATNFTLAEIVTYAKDFQKYTLGESMGFPNNRYSKNLYKIGSTEIANTLASNAIDVHHFLFADEEYQPSSTLKDIDSTIKNRINSGYYDEPAPEPEPEPEKPASTTTNNTTGSSGNAGGSSNGNAGSSSGGNTQTPPPPIVEEEFYEGDE